MDQRREITLDEEHSGVLRQLTLLEAELADHCKCHGDLLRVRLRTFSGGSKHHVEQCVRCGRQKGGALGAKVAKERLGFVEAPCFDEALQDSYREERVQLAQRASQLQRRYLELTDRERADEIFVGRDLDREKTQRVAKAIEDCGTALAVEVLPGQIADAMAQHVIALRRSLRDAELNSTRRFSSEKELKEWLVNHLSEDFELHAEVSGRHLAADAAVIIDYIAYPKPHLIEAGFAATHFGIEVKHLDQEDGFSRKASRAIWQAVSYTDSEFTVQGKVVRPKFAVLFSGLSFEAERRLLKNLGDQYENDVMVWRALLQLANHANVGTLEIKGTRDRWQGWKFAFSGGTYFTRSHYREAHPLYRASDGRLIDKVRVGNF